MMDRGFPVLSFSLFINPAPVDWSKRQMGFIVPWSSLHCTAYGLKQGIYPNFVILALYRVPAYAGIYLKRYTLNAPE
jgi:hypothetical protein